MQIKGSRSFLKNGLNLDKCLKTSGKTGLLESRRIVLEKDETYAVDSRTTEPIKNSYEFDEPPSALALAPVISIKQRYLDLLNKKIHTAVTISSLVRSQKLHFYSCLDKSSLISSEMQAKRQQIQEKQQKINEMKLRMDLRSPNNPIELFFRIINGFSIEGLDINPGFVSFSINISILPLKLYFFISREDHPKIKVKFRALSSEGRKNFIEESFISAVQGLVSSGTPYFSAEEFVGGLSFTLKSIEMLVNWLRSIQSAFDLNLEIRCNGSKIELIGRSMIDINNKLKISGDLIEWFQRNWLLESREETKEIALGEIPIILNNLSYERKFMDFDFDK